MAEKIKKTNAMRILDGLKIQYETRDYYDDGEHELSRGAAVHAAEKLGIDVSSCFKTIVMRNEKKEIFVFLEEADKEINLKKARNVSSSKELSPVKPEELLALTGYVRGGCSPLGMKKKYPVFIDEVALTKEKIYISAGVRGKQIVIEPNLLVKASSALTADLML